MAVSQTFHCDGPACTEESSEPINWLCTTVLAAGDTTTQTYMGQFNMRVFHNRTCLQAYLSSLGE